MFSNLEQEQEAQLGKIKKGQKQQEIFWMLIQVVGNFGPQGTSWFDRKKMLAVFIKVWEHNAQEIFLFHSDEEQEDLDGNSLFEFQQELETRYAVRMKFKLFFCGFWSMKQLEDIATFYGMLSSINQYNN